MVQNIQINIAHEASIALVAYIMTKPSSFSTSWSGYLTTQTHEETLLCDFYAAHGFDMDSGDARDWFQMLPTDLLALANAHIAANCKFDEEVEDVSEAFSHFVGLVMSDLWCCHLRETHEPNY
jgi:hypothetical protein